MTLAGPSAREHWPGLGARLRRIFGEGLALAQFVCTLRPVEVLGQPQSGEYGGTPDGMRRPDLRELNLELYEVAATLQEAIAMLDEQATIAASRAATEGGAELPGPSTSSWAFVARERRTLQARLTAQLADKPDEAARGWDLVRRYALFLAQDPEVEQTLNETMVDAFEAPPERKDEAELEFDDALVESLELAIEQGHIKHPRRAPRLVRKGPEGFRAAYRLRRAARAPRRVVARRAAAAAARASPSGDDPAASEPPGQASVAEPLFPARCEPVAEATSPALFKATADPLPAHAQPVAPVKPKGKARKLWMPPSPAELDALPPVLLAEDVAGLRRQTIGALLADVARGNVPGVLRHPGERGTLRFDRDVILRWLFSEKSPGGSRR